MLIWPVWTVQRGEIMYLGPTSFQVDLAAASGVILNIGPFDAGDVISEVVINSVDDAQVGTGEFSIRAQFVEGPEPANSELVGARQVTDGTIRFQSAASVGADVRIPVGIVVRRRSYFQLSFNDVSAGVDHDVRVGLVLSGAGRSGGLPAGVSASGSPGGNAGSGS